MHTPTAAAPTLSRRKTSAPIPGLLAAAALMIDYVLTAAVGISAGVGALSPSTLAHLQKHTLVICLGILLLLTLVNMRGVRETGGAFIHPHLPFRRHVAGRHLRRVWSRPLISGGHPHPVVAPPQLPAATAGVSLWLILKVFSSGCTAMTGVEAVSNGVTAFREPRCKTAKTTLTIIIALLIVLLAGIALLCRFYSVGAVDPGSPQYQSVLSELTAAVMGRGIFYYVTIGSILVVAVALGEHRVRRFSSPHSRHRAQQISARRLHHPRPAPALLARHLRPGHLYRQSCSSSSVALRTGSSRSTPLAPSSPSPFRRPAWSMHWRRVGGKGAGTHMLINGVGAFATGITVLVVLVAKFAEGAWITAVMVPLLIFLMRRVKRHYDRVAAEVDNPRPICLEDIERPIVLIPMDRWSRISEKGLRFALMLSDDIRAIHVHTGDDQDIEDKEDELTPIWQHMVVEPLQAAKLPIPKLIILRSPYRYIVQPLVEYILKVEAENPHRQIAVMVPELVVSKWWQNFLHNQRAQVLKLLLLVKGSQRVLVINIPWYLNKPPAAPPPDKSGATATTVLPGAKAN